MIANKSLFRFLLLGLLAMLAASARSLVQTSLIDPSAQTSGKPLGDTVSPVHAQVASTPTKQHTYLPLSYGQFANAVMIYSDQLSAGWQNWSWNTNINLANPSPVQAGSASIAVTYTDGYAGLYLHTDTALSTSEYSHLRFWVHGGTTGNQKIRVVANGTDPGYLATAVANQWTEVNVPLSSLGSPAGIMDLYWQDPTGGAQSTFYLDTIQLAGTDPGPQPTPIPGSGLALQVNALADQHPIDPNIYGINFADETLAAELRLPVNRYGGNATTRYNWKNDTSNRASDWFFENIPNENSNPGALPNGSASDQFVEQNQRTGTETLMTVPLIGWTPKARDYSCGFSVSKYGAQQSVDSWRTDCGNGVYNNGALITGNDPGDTSSPIGPAFVQEWIHHLTARYGTAANGGVMFYNLDNEPMLWNSTHRDVHPTPVSYDELRDLTYQYAAAIKAADPSAKTLGPVLWGWTAYFYSAKDAAQGGNWWDNPIDRKAHGNLPFIEWYLQQMRAYEQTKGQRILDYMDLHYYPQASGVALSSAGDADTQARRLRSTRSLWDPAYTDESWIGEAVRLIPRMRDWVNGSYPGTQLAITEYNWGALDHINGALAQADVLGIFGREGLDLATLWSPPSSSQPGAFAFRMYRNYDGLGRGFGETSVQASSADQDTLSIYAAKRTADGALTLMVINKTISSQAGTVSLANFQAAAQAQVYRYSGSNLNAIVRQANQPVSGGKFTAAFPANSITLVVIPKP